MTRSILPTILLVLTINSCYRTTIPKVPTEDEMKAYLLVYFKDSDHSLHMAISADGYSFTDINKGNPVIAGDTIALQKGIRDPHIMRGADNMFYLTMTDLHIYAKRFGYRETEWERPINDYGWGNNKGFIIMKSPDLINWTHTSITISDFFQGYDSIGCAWAPQTIWDKQVGKPMLYYTMRFKDGSASLYYSYANKEFNRMETEPKPLFRYPQNNIYCIDGDITKENNKYHLFYVPHDGTPGIKQAVSEQINKGYDYDSVWYDSEKVKCEAPNIWKRIGEDKWVLMYDIYGLRPANFGFRETSDFKNFTDLGRFNEGKMKSTNFDTPKHGAVIHLTKNEADLLCKHWGLEIIFNKL